MPKGANVHEGGVIGKDSHEGGVATRANQEESARKERDAFERYKQSGGIINFKDYDSAMRRKIETITASDTYMAQVETMADLAGIELKNTKDAIDPRVKLYGILRSDKKPKDVKEHHSDMSIQSLFAEVLRMEGDTESLKKLIKANHQVGTHCPICLKVVKSGEACR